MSRKVSRKHAFVIIYQMPFHSQLDIDELADTYLSELKSLDDADRVFIFKEIHGTLEHLEAIDALIAGHVAGWQIDRLSKVDLALMRLSVFELTHMGDVPTGVSINEAVELAKTYGDDNSPAFINGVLRAVALAVRGEGQ